MNFISMNDCVRIYNHSIGVVLRSEYADVKVGDHIYGVFRESCYILSNEVSMLKIVIDILSPPLSHSLPAIFDQA
jgi:hypothetical protein